MHEILLRFATTTTRIRFLIVLAIAVGWGAGRVDALVEDHATSVEGCIGCHAKGGVVPVGDVSNPSDRHYVDLDPRGPETQSGYSTTAAASI